MRKASLRPAIIVSLMAGLGLCAHIFPAKALTPGERCGQLRQYVFTWNPPSIGSPMYRCGLSKGADCSGMDKGPLTIEWINRKCWNYDPPGYYRDSNRLSCASVGHLGRVRFTNNHSYPIVIKLWHPDSASIHTEKTANAGSTITFDDNVGDNWGIQLGSSKIMCIGRSSRWDGGSFLLDAESMAKLASKENP
jgi:hypothetical protein